MIASIFQGFSICQESVPMVQNGALLENKTSQNSVVRLNINNHHVQSLIFQIFMQSRPCHLSQIIDMYPFSSSRYEFWHDPAIYEIWTYSVIHHNSIFRVLHMHLTNNNTATNTGKSSKDVCLFWLFCPLELLKSRVSYQKGPICHA